MKKCGGGQMWSVFISNHNTCKTEVTHVCCVGLTLCAVIRRLLHPIDSSPTPTTHTHMHATSKWSCLLNGRRHCRHRQQELQASWCSATHMWEHLVKFCRHLKVSAKSVHLKSALCSTRRRPLHKMDPHTHTYHRRTSLSFSFSLTEYEIRDELTLSR